MITAAVIVIAGLIVGLIFGCVIGGMLADDNDYRNYLDR